MQRIKLMIRACRIKGIALRSRADSNSAILMRHDMQPFRIDLRGARWRGMAQREGLSLDPAADMGAKRGRKLGQTLNAGCVQHHPLIFGIADHNLGPLGLQCDDERLGSHAWMQAG